MIHRPLRPLSRAVLPALFAALFLSACTDSVAPMAPGGGSGGGNAGGAGGGSAGSDAGADGGADAGADAGSDAGVDGGSDAGLDGGADAGADGGMTSCDQCAAGATQCSGDERQTCVTRAGDGCHVWSSPASCSFDSSCGGAGVCSASSATPWTVLIYMAADNSREADALASLAQLTQVGSNAQVKLVVQIDRGLKYTSANAGNISWTAPGAKRLLAGDGSFTLLQDLGAVDSGDTTVFSDFLHWGVTNYPAQHTLLVLWGHGGGSRFGFGVDESSNDRLTLAGLKGALASGLAGTSTSKFDLLGFDAPLMASLEVVDSLGGFANFVLASEELSPGAGWDYTRLAELKSTPSTDPIQLGKDLADAYVAQDKQATATLSLIDVTQVAQVLRALAAAMTALEAQLPALDVAIAAARRGTLEYGKSSQPARAFQLVDLGDFFAQLALQSSSTQPLATAMNAALKAAVLYSRGGTSEAQAHGLSVYFPPVASLYDQAGYTALGDTAGFGAFLSAWFASSAAQPLPKFVPDAGLSVVKPAAGGLVLVSSTLDAGTELNAATATLYYGLSAPESDAGLNDDQIYFLGDNTASIAQASVSGVWQLDWFQLSQTLTAGSAPLASPCYLELAYQSGGTSVASIPLVYLPAGATACNDARALPAMRQLVFTLNGTVLQDSLYATENGAAAELTPAAGSHLAAQVPFFFGSKKLTQPPLSAGWSCLPTRFDATQPITYSAISATTSGTNLQEVLQLQVKGASGAGDTRSAFGPF